jgi:phosphate/sulfate permease
MNIFAMARLFSPVGGAVGSAMAVHRVAPSTPAWMWAAIPVGLMFGIGCYRGLIRLAIGKHDKNPNMPDWRAATILGITFFAPLIAGALSYGLFSLLFNVVD